LGSGAGELVNPEFAFALTDLHVLQAKALFASFASNSSDGIAYGLCGFRVTVGRKLLRVTQMPSNSIAGLPQMGRPGIVGSPKPGAENCTVFRVLDQLDVGWFQRLSS